MRLSDFPEEDLLKLFDDARRNDVFGDYGQQIRDKVEPMHKGKFLVIDIETGEYEISADDLGATKRLLAKYPNAVVYGLRIGFPTAYRIGGHFSMKT